MLPHQTYNYTKALFFRVFWRIWRANTSQELPGFYTYRVAATHWISTLWGSGRATGEVTKGHDQGLICNVGRLTQLRTGSALILVLLSLLTSACDDSVIFVGHNLTTLDGAVAYCNGHGGQLATVTTPEAIRVATEVCADAHPGNPWGYCHVGYETGVSVGDGAVTWRAHALDASGHLVPLDVLGDVVGLPVCEVSP